ncbi:hypothetical protein K438DRAFT_682643 [Mycena galopus ATCC 62051]|nr:hypothetical protein K438DRAFT_682643 [Mycena galopus ATCC 62051]
MPPKVDVCPRRTHGLPCSVLLWIPIGAYCQHNVWQKLTLVKLQVPGEEVSAPPSSIRMGPEFRAFSYSGMGTLSQAHIDIDFGDSGLTCEMICTSPRIFHSTVILWFSPAPPPPQTPRTESWLAFLPEQRGFRVHIGSSEIQSHARHGGICLRGFKIVNNSQSVSKRRPFAGFFLSPSDHRASCSPILYSVRYFVSAWVRT